VTRDQESDVSGGAVRLRGVDSLVAVLGLAHAHSAFWIRERPEKEGGEQTGSERLI
jgi:hypothetical protein